MQSAAGEKPKMWGPSIIGFGSYHYKYESGREGDMPVIAFSPRKSATVLYGMIGFDEAAPLLAKLGKHRTGKGCLYIKNLADVDQHVLEALAVNSLAAKRAGLLVGGGGTGQPRRVAGHRRRVRRVVSDTVRES
jgi:Domain of unknown function (DU1801)